MRRKANTVGALTVGLLFAVPLYASNDIPVLKSEPQGKMERTEILLASSDNPPKPQTVIRQDPRNPEPAMPAAEHTIYVPPRYGAPTPALRMGGSTRGGAVAKLDLAVLAPNHVGETRQAQPILYWYVSRYVTEPVEFTLIPRHAVAPVLRTILPGPFTRGIHAVRLADFGAVLESDTTYEWSVAVITNRARRSHDAVATGEIIHVKGKSVSSPSLGEEYLDYATRGLWYDAMMSLTNLIDVTRAPSALRLDRAALAEEVGLPMVAAYDRALTGLK